jgi:hypothetical protein
MEARDLRTEERTAVTEPVTALNRLSYRLTGGPER